MNKLAPYFVILGASLWGVDGIVLRPSLYGLPVSLVVFVETAIVAVILSFYFWNRLDQLRSLKYKDWLAFSGVALFGGAIGTMAITKALFYVNFVNLSIVVLIQKLQPVFAVSLAALLLKERLSKTFFIWASLAIIGAYIMTFGKQLPVINSEDKTAVAALFAVIATMSFASSTVLSKRALRNVEFGIGTYLRFLITSILMLFLVTGMGSISVMGQINQKQAVVLLIIAFSTGGPAIFLYYFGLKRIKASVATICELSFPLTAVILEYLIRGNILQPFQWIGAGLLLISIVRVSRLQVTRS